MSLISTLDAQMHTPSRPNTSNKTHGCYLITKTIIYTEDTTDIRRRKEIRNSYKHYLQKPPSTGRKRDKNMENTISVPSSINHNF